MVLDRFPLHDQAVAAGDLDYAFEVHTVASFGGQEERTSLRYGRFEVGSVLGLYRQRRHFPYHSRFAFSCSASMDCSMPVSTIVRVASTVA